MKICRKCAKFSHFAQMFYIYAQGISFSFKYMKTIVKMLQNAYGEIKRMLILWFVIGI